MPQGTSHNQVMNKALVISSFAIALIGISPSANAGLREEAQASPKKRNLLYSQSYDYTFKKDKNVLNCVARASATLAENGLSKSIGTSINEGEQYGIAYGWSRDGTETAEISCNRKQKLTILVYANFTNKEMSTIWKRWKILKDSRW